MQQATVNLLGNVGVPPATPQPVASPATADSDTTATISTITAPLFFRAVPTGQLVTTQARQPMSGEDRRRGGVPRRRSDVAAVRRRGGVDLHVRAPDGGTAMLLSQAVEDSGNVKPPARGRSVTVTRPCPFSTWHRQQAPQMPSSVTSYSATMKWVEVGNETSYVRERSDDGAAGWAVTGSRATNVVTFTDPALASRRSCYFRVRAVSSGGSSVPSATVPVRAISRATP